MPESNNPVTAAIKTVDAEAFKQTVFFRLVISKPPVRRKVKSMAKLQEYLAKLQEEQKTGGNGNDLAISGTMSEIQSNPVGVTKRIFIPIPPKKEKGQRQEIVDPMVLAGKYLDDSKRRLCGPYGAAQPSRIMDGLFVLPESRVPEYVEHVKDIKNKLTLEYLPPVESGYDDAMKQAETAPLRQGGLGPLFDRNDYLSAEDFCAQYDIDILWLKLGVPDNLPKELQDQFRQDFNARAQAATEEIFAALRLQFSELIDHAVGMLQPGEDGKAKKIMGSNIENLREFCAIFQDRNIFNDDQLATLVERARTVLTGANVETMRKDGAARDSMHAQFAKLKEDLDKMVTTTTGRKFNLED